MVEALEQRRRLGAHPRAVEQAEPARLVAEEDALGDAQVLDQVELLVDRPDPEGHGLRRLADGQQLAVDADLSLGRGDHARHALDQRRLPGPVGTEQAVHLPGAHVEVHALQGEHPRVLLLDPPDLEQWCALAHPATPAASIDTSTQRSSRAERSTASVRRAARRPSANSRHPVGGRAGHDRLVDLGDEGVEAVRVALRMAGREHRVALGGGGAGAPGRA